ncbi:energy transducer TonB [Methylobacter sp. YRD-M1]|uniref:energy transducer TonB n=1 Tax=Methylobacter sp. YRD-M1 TaxID=2911520 RepID=UPI00227BD06D|nr:energy transducer TonB [Methylobacter sp. YRD-M1]WAK02355.1 energy transducer TonB [Methylobacter sp. YRD-M1]
MNRPVTNFQQVEPGITSPNNLARIFSFKTAANEFDASFLPSTGAGAVLSDFRFEFDKGDRKLIDYLALGVLSIFIHASLVDHFKRADFEQEEIVQPKVPPKVQITLVKPQPKPVIQPPPPPPPKAKPKPVQKKAVPLKPQKPKVKPKPVEEVVEPTPQPVITDESAPVSPAPVAAPPAPPVEEKVTQPHAGADYLHNPAPEYPEIAMERGWEGRVLMKVHVQPDGKPDEISVIQSSGKKVLDDAAVSTVKKWSFVPAKRGDTPIAGWVTVPITFNLS